MKFKISIDYTEYYQEMEIEAESEEEARDKYLEMIQQGSVLSVNGEYRDFKVSKII